MTQPTNDDRRITEAAREIVATLAAGFTTDDIPASGPLWQTDLQSAVAKIEAEPRLLPAVLGLGAWLHASLALFIANDEIRRIGLPYEVDDDRLIEAETKQYVVERARGALVIMFKGAWVGERPNDSLS